jgi:Fe2+ transport system protein FeoA
MNSCSLSNLFNGQSARVTRLNAETPAEQRLLAIGLQPGSLVKCESTAPLGDPVALSFHNQCVSMRRADIRHIEAEVVTA